MKKEMVIIMKKYISLIICMLMIFSVYSHAASPACAANALAQADSSFHGQMLNALGIFENFGGTNFNSGTVITKSQMCNITANILFSDSISYTRSKTYFTDVPYDYWALPQINALAQIGVVSGNGNGIFEPEKQITLFECLKIWTVALDYESLCQAKGGWPYGYYTVAHDLGMLDEIEIQGSDKVTGAVLAHIIANSLEVPFMNLSIGEPGSGFQTNETGTDTLLKRRGIEISEGRVIRNDVTSLTVNGNAEDEGFVNIDGVLYKSGESNVGEFLGAEVKFYYVETGLSDTILFAYPVYGYDKQIINMRDIISASRHEIRYFASDDTEKTARIADGAYFISNARTVSYNDSFFDMKSGEIVLTGFDNSSSFNMVSANSYVHYIASGISTDGKSVYLKDFFHNGEGFIDIDTQTVHIIKDGKKISADSINNGDIISMFCSGDGEYIRIEILNGKFSGTITEFGDETLRIDNVEYKLSGEFTTKNGVAPKVGKTASFYKDRFGEIFYADFESLSHSDYGFVFAGRSENLGQSYSFNVLTGQSNFEEIFLASKVKITDASHDGATMNAVDAYSYVMAKLSENPTLIKYTLNSDGNASHIELPVAGSPFGSDDGTFRLDLTMTNTQFVAHGRVGNIAHVNGNTRYFVVAKEKSGDRVTYKERASYASNSYFITGNNTASEENPIHFYDVGKNGYAAAVLVIDETDEFEFGSIGDLGSYRVHVFDECRKTIDKNGDEITVIVAWVDGVEKRLVVSDDCKSTEKSLVHGLENLKFGDAFVIAKNKNDEVCAYEVIHRADEVKYGNIFGAGGGYYNVYSTETSVFVGKLYYYDASTIRIKCGDTLYSFSASSCAVTLVDSDEEIISTGSTNDLRHYAHNDPDGGSLVMINTNRSALNDIVIYE